MKWCGPIRIYGTFAESTGYFSLTGGIPEPFVKDPYRKHLMCEWHRGGRLAYLIHAWQSISKGVVPAAT